LDSIIDFIFSLVYFKYTDVILIRCIYTNGKPNFTTYNGITTKAFIGVWVIFILNVRLLLGCPILYMVLAGANLVLICQVRVAEIGDIP
jgi:hypothetical protein